MNASSAACVSEKYNSVRESTAERARERERRRGRETKKTKKMLMMKSTCAGSTLQHPTVILN